MISDHYHKKGEGRQDEAPDEVSDNHGATKEMYFASYLDSMSSPKVLSRKTASRGRETMPRSSCHASRALLYVRVNWQKLCVHQDSTV